MSSALLFSCSSKWIRALCMPHCSVFISSYRQSMDLVSYAELTTFMCIFLMDFSLLAEGASCLYLITVISFITSPIN